MGATLSFNDPVATGTGATGALYTMCKIQDIDMTNKLAHVIDQTGKQLVVTITRMPGKAAAYPAIGEQWIITRQYGDWSFAMSVNVPPVSSVGPQGPQGAVGPQGAIGSQGAIGPQGLTEPTGVVKIFAGSSAPTGYQLCDGSAISRSTFSALFTIIGTTYGVGNGTTTFNVPNLLGKTVVGVDATETEFNALGVTGGEKTHLLTTPEMPSHSHTESTHAHSLSFDGGASPQSVEIVGPSGSTTSNRFVLAAGTNDWGTSQASGTIANTGGGTAHNNLQPYISMNYIIKL